MKNRDKIDLRREKLRNLILKEIDEYQYEVYSNNGSETLLNKFNTFKNYNYQKGINEEEKNNYLNNRNNININNEINNYQNQNIRNISYNNIPNGAEQNNSLNNNINNILPNQENGQSNIKNNNQQGNGEQDFYFRNNINQQNYENKINSNRNNNNESYKYGNTSIDEELNGYTDYYNKLKVDEFMSKKRIQDDLLNQINQKLDKINKNINDKTYQEYLAFQYFQNKNRANNENAQ